MASDNPARCTCRHPAQSAAIPVCHLPTADGGLVRWRRLCPAHTERFLTLGSEPAPSTPEELSKRYADWIERFDKIAKQAGLKPQ